MEYKNTTTSFSCLNASNENKLLRDCILTQCVLDDNFNIKIGDDIIERGSSCQEVIDVLNKYNYNIQHGKVDNYCNYETVQQGRWTISIKISDETSTGLLKSIYKLDGTSDNGLEQISIDLDVITEEQLEDLYFKRST